MKRNLIGGGMVVLILLGAAAYHYFTGSEMGGPCRLKDDCKGNLYGKFGSQCFDVGNGQERFCTTTCESTADCPSGWACEQVDYVENDVKKGTSRVCNRPTATAPAKRP
jgi:hypothetical protein